MMSPNSRTTKSEYKGELAPPINYGTKIYIFLLELCANRFKISASVVKWERNETSQIFMGHPVYECQCCLKGLPHKGVSHKKCTKMNGLFIVHCTL